MRFVLPGILITRVHLPLFFGNIHESLSSHDIGLKKDFRAVNAPVHMGFSSEIHHRVDIVLTKDLPDFSAVPDIALLKMIPGMVFISFEIIPVPRIGEEVHVHDLKIRI